VEIELKGATFMASTVPGWVEGKRITLSVTIDADASVATAVDARKGGAWTLPVDILRYTVKDEDGVTLSEDLSYGVAANVTFGLVQEQYQSSGERTISVDFSDPGATHDSPARLLAFRTFGSVWLAEPDTITPPDTDVPGTGLRGKFWQNKDMLGEPLEDLVDVPPYIDPGDDDYGPGSGDAYPPPSIDKERDYSARWTGRIKFPEAGQYRFAVQVDDGFRLYLNGREVMSYWKENHDNRVYSGWLTKTAGQVDVIWIEFFSNNQETSRFDMSWQTPSSPTVRVYPPITVFYPSDGTEAPPEEATRPPQALWCAEDVTRYA
jgi:hypothetical protein